MRTILLLLFFLTSWQIFATDVYLVGEDKKREVFVLGNDGWQLDIVQTDTMGKTNAVSTYSVHFPGLSPREILEVYYYRRARHDPPNNAFVALGGEEIHVFGVNRRTGTLIANTNTIPPELCPVYELSAGGSVGSVTTKNGTAKIVQTWSCMFEIDNSGSTESVVAWFTCTPDRRRDKIFSWPVTVPAGGKANFAPTIRAAKKQSNWDKYNYISAKFERLQFNPFYRGNSENLMSHKQILTKGSK